MLGLFEEALIQYDEIDALLTQLVINSKFGGEYMFTEQWQLLECVLLNTCSYCTLVNKVSMIWPHQLSPVSRILTEISFK